MNLVMGGALNDALTKSFLKIFKKVQMVKRYRFKIIYKKI